MENPLAIRMSSSSESLTLTSPRSSGTTKSVVLVHQPAGQIIPQTNLKPIHCKESVRRQIHVVVRNLEAVVSELNSVMNELQGVLEQIDRVTSCLDSRLSGKSLRLQHSTDDEKLWTTRRKRSVSSACSISTHQSKSNSSSTTSTSSSSTDLSSLWKLPRKTRSRSSSSGKPSHRKTKKILETNPNSNQDKRKQESDLKSTESNKRHSKHLQKHESLELRIKEAKDDTKPTEESTKVRLRDKKRNHKRAFLHGICCVRTQSMYSAESDPRRSLLSDDGTWVLRKGNGVKSPMYPGVLLPVVMDDKDNLTQKMPRSFSEGNISSCSNRDNKCSQTSAANLKISNSREPSLNHTPNRTSGIASSISDETLHTNSSGDLFRSNEHEKSLFLTLDSDEHIPLMTYLKSPVSSAHMLRRSDVIDDSSSNRSWSRRRPPSDSSYTRKPKNGIYQYESETEVSQPGMNLSDKEVNVEICSPVSIPSGTLSIGPTLSEIEPDMVETDSEIEFSLMQTIPAEKKLFKSSNSLSFDHYPGLTGSFSSLAESEEFIKRYRIYSYDSECDRNNKRSDSRESNYHAREKELAAEGLKLLLYGNDSKTTEDISEQKQKIMMELDNLKLSFNSASSTPESENEKILRRSLTQFDDFSPDSQPLELSDTMDPNSPGRSNGESPLSNGFEADPEVKAFLQELDQKIKERGSKSGSVDNISVFTGSKESLAVSDTMFSRKLTEAVLDENSNIKLNSIFRNSMDSVMTDDSRRGCSSDPGDSDHLMESFEWEHSFTFSMYQETGSKIPDFSPDGKDADKTLESNFKNFDLDEALTYSLSYPLEKAKSTSLSSESFIWSEGSINSDRRLDSTGKSVDELLSELDISADLLSKSTLKRPETLVPSIDQIKSESLPRSDGNVSDYKVSYNRDINTWTAFAMVHIGGSDSNLSRCSGVSDGASQTSSKSNNKLFSPKDSLSKANTAETRT
ncbi:uncharacterized protein [Apostichopus japonicus]|uniref:uncharacterized protein n=1 Tax=Stichopus japonicus TaxID=307972 RepID=UPI003AB83CBE